MRRRSSLRDNGGPLVGPLVVAHRGAWAQAPQNSLRALADAIAIGCEMVELDVRRTRDGQLVVVHDARIGGSPVGALDLAEVRARLGAGRAPLLEEVAEQAAGRIALDVELKANGYAEPALAVLGRHLEPETYVVTSFRDSVLAAVRQAAPEVRTGLLLRPGRPPRRLESRLEVTGASFLAPQASVARAGLLAWSAHRGIECFVWTVNDRRVLRTLLADPRVAAVITDRPESALELRAEIQLAADKTA
jgi:glycerophosphoryl diester phosphodiesterase